MKRYYFAIIIVIFSLTLIPAQTQAQGVAQDLLGRINGLRAELGLAPYSLNGALTAAAQSHAQWMADTQQVTHVQDNGSSPQTRAQANGYASRWVSENIYMGGLASVDSAWNFWINSPIHYRGLTSANFQDIGIASAQGAGGEAFVLVFGVPPGSSAVVSNSGNSNAASNEPAAPPIAIVGYDEVGNIQYELQAGDTLGDVLLLFGYTWDDLNTIMGLNAFTDADIRSLDVGQVVLVPPPQGTYTPTPLAEEITEEAIVEVTEEALAEVTEPATSETIVSTEILPTPMQTADAQTSGIIPTPEPDTSNEQGVQTDEQIGQPATFVAVTVSPTVTSTITPIPTLQINNQPTTVSVAQVNTQSTEVDVAQVNTPTSEPILEASSPEKHSNTPPLWLVGAIVVQVGVLAFATIEYIRRQRR